MILCENIGVYVDWIERPCNILVKDWWWNIVRSPTAVFSTSYLSLIYIVTIFHFLPHTIGLIYSTYYQYFFWKETTELLVFSQGVSSASINPILLGVFGSYFTRGGAQICPHPLKMVGNGWEVSKLSWNLISYRDWCPTKGFTPFRHLEPSQLVVTF